MLDGEKAGRTNTTAKVADVVAVADVAVAADVRRAVTVAAARTEPPPSIPFPPIVASTCIHTILKCIYSRIDCPILIISKETFSFINAKQEDAVIRGRASVVANVNRFD